MDIEFDLETEGFAITRGLIPPAAIDEYLEGAYAGLSEAQKDNLAFQSHPWVRSVLCHHEINRFAAHWRLNLALHSCLLKQVDIGLPWHCDLLAGERHWGIWVALGPITKENGPFQIIPGSHLWDFDRSDSGLSPENMEISPTVDNVIDEYGAPHPEFFIAEAGDVLIWDTFCIHGAMKPLDPTTRRTAAIGHYAEHPMAVTDCDDGVRWVMER